MKFALATLAFAVASASAADLVDLLLCTEAEYVVRVSEATTWMRSEATSNTLRRFVASSLRSSPFAQRAVFALVI